MATTSETGSALCPFCLVGNVDIPGDPNKARINGSIVTPSPTFAIDLSKADSYQFRDHIDSLHLHRRWDGRPVIEHLCPVAGMVIHVYCDVEGGSHQASGAQLALQTDAVAAAETFPVESPS